MRVPLSTFSRPRTARARGPPLCDRLKFARRVGGRGLIKVGVACATGVEIEVAALFAWEGRFLACVWRVARHRTWQRKSNMKKSNNLSRVFAA